MKRSLAVFLAVILSVWGLVAPARAISQNLEITVTSFKGFNGENCGLVTNKQTVDLNSFLTGTQTAKFTATCSGKGTYVISGFNVNFTDDTHATASINLRSMRLGKVKGSVTWPAAYGSGCISSDGKIRLLDEDVLEIETSGTLTEVIAGNYSYESYAVLNHNQTASLNGSPCRVSGEFKMPRTLATNRFYTYDLTSFAAKLHITTLLTDQQIATGCEVMTNEGETLTVPEADLYVDSGAKYFNSVLSVSLQCDSYVSGETELNVPYEVYAGYPKNITLDFDRPMVTIGGKVNFSYAACKTAVLSFSPTINSARDNTPIQIGSDGSYSAPMAPGKYVITVIKDADTDRSLDLAQCTIDDNERYIAVSNSSYDLNSTVGKYSARPAAGATSTGCALSQQGYLPLSTTEISVTIRCDNAWSITKTVPVALVAGDTQVVDVVVPSHKLVTVTGALNFPALSTKSSRSNPAVLFYPAQSFDTLESTSGWQKLDTYGYPDRVEATVTRVNDRNYQYSAQVPEGSYIIDVIHQKLPATGCMPAQTHYSASAAAMQSYFGANAAFAVAYGDAGTQAGPELALKLGSQVVGSYARSSTFYLQFENALGQAAGATVINSTNRGKFSTPSVCLEAGNYTVKASVYGNYSKPAANITAISGQNITLSPMPEVDDSAFKPIAAQVTGTLVDSLANPLSDVSVIAVCEDGAYSIGKSDSSGVFALDGLRDDSICRFIFVASGVSLYANTNQYTFLGNTTTFEDSIALRSLTYADLGNITLDYSGHSNIIPDIFVEQHDKAMNSEWLHAYSNLLEAHSWITATLPILHADESGVVEDVVLDANSSLRKSPYYDVWIYRESDFETFAPDTHYQDKAAYLNGVLYWPDDMRVPEGTSFIVLSDNGSEKRYLITATRGLATPIQTIVSALGASAKVGKNLTANVGNWEDDSGENTQTFTYRWFSCDAQQAAQVKTLPSGCNVIASATSFSYKPTRSDRGKYLIAEITAANTAGSAKVYTNSTAKVK
ncbi:MAG: hypothetical protein ACKOWE_05775 [Micrococcales bacterium]